MFRNFLKEKFKIFRGLIVITLIFSWVFSGWPFGIKIAQAALPTFVAAGASTKGLGAITPGMPAGVLTNDILLLFIETSDAAITVSGGTETWAEVTGSPVTGATGTDLTVFWARASQNSPTSPDTSDSGDHQLAIILAFRGVITSGDPWDITGTGTAASGTSVSFPSVTTTVIDTMIVHAIAGDGPDGNSTANLSGESNAALANLTEQSDNRVNTGDGGLLGAYTGEKATVGSTGNTTATLANAATQAMMTIALKPPVVTAADLSWDTGAPDFEIWAGATATSDAFLTWDDGTLICSTSLTDDNTRQSTCGSINKNQRYRVQVVLENIGGTAVSMNGAGDFVDQVNVKTFWAGTNPTISAATNCRFDELGGTDDGATTCNVAFNGNDVRITNTGAGNVVIAATTGTEGFMYLITTDSNVSLSDSSTYMNADIDTITEDSSRITIGQNRTKGIRVRGGIKIRGVVKFR